MRPTTSSAGALACLVSFSLPPFPLQRLLSELASRTQVLVLETVTLSDRVQSTVILWSVQVFSQRTLV